MVLFYYCSLHFASGCPSQPSFLFLALSPPNTRTLNVILFSYPILNKQYFSSLLAGFLFGDEVNTLHSHKSLKVEVLRQSFLLPLACLLALLENPEAAFPNQKVFEWILQHLPAATLLSPEKQSSPAPCVCRMSLPTTHGWFIWKREPRQGQRPGRGPSLVPEGLRPQLKINILVSREDVGRD